MARNAGKGEMKSVHKLLLKFVNKCLLPRSERRHKDTYLDLELMEVFHQNSPINLPSPMMKYMARAADHENGIHALPYRFLLTSLFEHF